jgi:hypothetical protein
MEMIWIRWWFGGFGFAFAPLLLWQFWHRCFACCLERNGDDPFSPAPVSPLFFICLGSTQAQITIKQMMMCRGFLMHVRILLRFVEKLVKICFQLRKALGQALHFTRNLDD